MPRPLSVRLQHVDLRRGGRPVLRDLSWHIGPGERWVVLGPNGSGKTTLLSLIGGMLPLTSGSFKWKGEDIAGQKPHRIAAMGIVKTFQNPQLFPELTVVAYNRALEILESRKGGK